MFCLWGTHVSRAFSPGDTGFVDGEDQPVYYTQGNRMTISCCWNKHDDPWLGDRTGGSERQQLSPNTGTAGGGSRSEAPESTCEASPCGLFLLTLPSPLFQSALSGTLPLAPARGGASSWRRWSLLDAGVTATVSTTSAAALTSRSSVWKQVSVASRPPSSSILLPGPAPKMYLWREHFYGNGGTPSHSVSTGSCHTCYFYCRFRSVNYIC